MTFKNGGSFELTGYMNVYIYIYHSLFSLVIVITYHFFQSVVMGIFMDPNLTIPDICLKDAHLSRFMVHT